MEAIYPDVRADSARPGPARSETLSCVSDYQFGWSITYNYADEVSPLLPAGTVIHVTTWHDNSDNNKFNPNPKNWVGSGQRTNDEMGFAWVSLFYLDDADYRQRMEAGRMRSGFSLQRGRAGGGNVDHSVAMLASLALSCFVAVSADSSTDLHSAGPSSPGDRTWSPASTAALRTRTALSPWFSGT